MPISILRVAKRKSQGDRQQRHQIQGVGRADGKVEGIPIGRTKGVQEKASAARFKHQGTS